MSATSVEPVDPFEELRGFQTDVLTMPQAIEHLGRGAVRWALRSGRWTQPHRGVVVCHNGPLTRRQRLWLAVLAGPPGTTLAGPTAAELSGLVGFFSEQIHVVIPAGARRFRMPGVRVHWSSRLDVVDVHPVLQPRRTRLPRSLIDMVSWAANDDIAQSVIAAGVQQRLTTPAALHEAASRRGRFKRSRLTAETIEDVAGGAHSLPELEFGRILRGYQLPHPTRQRTLLRPDGRRYLDAEWQQYGVSAEIYGVPHMQVVQWDADLDRTTDITADGRRVLQFTSYAVRHHAARVAERLARALRTGGWSG
jgi:hypothetical protein